MKNIVLLIVDVQTALVEKQPCNKLNVIGNIKELIKIARGERIEVVYVQHDGGIDDELEKNTEGWRIYSDVAPNPNEKIFDKKFNSSFKETGLHEYLNAKDIETIILVGMQTEYCIDATCKVAFEYGYSLIIPQNTTTTYENQMFSGETLIEYYEHKIWANRFAQVIPVSEVIERMLKNTE